MKLTLAGEYGVRTVLDLSLRKEGEVAQISDISEEWDIPQSFLRKIVPLLAKAGIVRSSRGIGGGVELARSSQTITLLDVIEAIEGPISLNTCVLGPESCERSDWCSVHDVWCEAQAAMKQVLSKRSFKEIADRTNRKRHKRPELILIPSHYTSNIA